MSELMRNFVKDESGQDLAEYALLLALIALLAVGAIGVLSDGINAKFNEAASTINQ